MTIINALVLGIIQGLTEFIPVSSTAHLLIAQYIMGLPADDAAFAFNVLIQLGTTLALIIYFWRDLIALVRAFFTKPFSTPENKLAWYIIIAMIPALLAGVLLKTLVQGLFKIPLLEAAIRLLSAAFLLFVAEWLGKRSRSLETMTWLDALIVGLFQVLAVFPGASRSGSTISGGMLRGFDRPAAARFAFLTSVPVLLAAGAYEIKDAIKLPQLGTFLPLIAVGFITAAVVGWFSIRWLLNYLNKNSLYIFVVYCAIVGALCLFFLFIEWILSLAPSLLFSCIVS
jgi:undecaprenyl-diphosphatase